MTPLHVTLFGGYACSFDGIPLSWTRHMDKRIFRYLVLAPNGSATRIDIAATFWPDDSESARQLRLRSACSNIRRALGTAIPNTLLANYFVASPKRIAVNLSRLHVDVRRYLAHARFANEHYAMDAPEIAAEHYRQAIELYGGQIGWGHESEPWLEPLARECAQLYRLAVERLAEAARSSGAHDLAVRYEGVLAGLTLGGVS